MAKNYWKLFSPFSDAQSMMPEASSKVARLIMLTVQLLSSKVPSLHEGKLMLGTDIIVQRSKKN